MNEQKQSLADTFRALADVIDKHPELEGSFQHVGMLEHRFGDDAAALDVLADAFGIEVEHGEPNNGKRYSYVKARLGVTYLGLQAYTEDYEAATGKTVTAPAATS